MEFVLKITFACIRISKSEGSQTNCYNWCFYTHDSAISNADGSKN